MPDNPKPSEEQRNGSAEQPQSGDSQVLTGWRLASVFSGMLLSVFLTALDQSIVATAIPRIASEFDALYEISWIASAYFLTQAGLLLTFGQFLTIIPNKWVYLVAIFVFELGSLLCGVAPSVKFLIFGRAVQGSGAAGIFISVLSLIAVITKLEDRPLFIGLFGAVYAVSSVAGPLLGGAFTDHVTWRWCFYINLPIGAVSFVSVFLLLKAIPPLEHPERKNKTRMQKFLIIDWVGTILCLGMVTCLLLALHWGGSEKPWGSADIIALFCVFGVSLFLLMAWEHHRGEDAIIPLHLLHNRTLSCGSFLVFFVALGMLVGVYYLPLWYQATRGHSATRSGIDILALQLAVIIAAGGSGALISVWGRYWPFLLVCPALFAVGSGLLFTIGTTSSTGKMIGSQILFGVGIGGALQNALVAVQAEYADRPVTIPQATSFITFTQLIGGIVGIGVAGTVFNNQLDINLARYAPDLPDELAEAVQEQITVIYESSFPASMRAQVITAYIKSLDPIFLIGVPSGALASFFSLFVRNWHMKERAAATAPVASEPESADKAS